MSELIEKANNAIAEGTLSEHDLDPNDLDKGYILLIQEKKPKNFKDSIPDMKEGDFVRTDLEEIISDDPLEIIPLSVSKSWRLLDPQNEFRRVGWEPFKGNISEKGQMEDGTHFVRRMQYSYVVMLASDVDSIPLILNLKGMSISAAKKVNTHLLRLNAKGLAPWGFTVELRSIMDTSKKGDDYYKILAKPGRATTEEEIEKAQAWAERLSSQPTDIDPEVSENSKKDDNQIEDDPEFIKSEDF